jgi:hypothetical protein
MGITGDTALRLGKYFGASAELWLGLKADIVTPVETGVHPPDPRIWIPFFNGMTDAVRQLDSGPGSDPGWALCRNDERKSRLPIDHSEPLGSKPSVDGAA